jgi:RNA polymerase sigma-70 factor (ECF subfamily)
MTGTRNIDASALDAGFEEFRLELTAFCYRMLGSAFDADDAVQETLVRAWKSFGGFEGRSSLRAWLYRIASNVCFDQLKGRQRRAMPIDLLPAGRGDAPVEAPWFEQPWLGPIPDARVMPASVDPAEVAIARASVRLAFVAALQHLPPRQRAVLILREVLKWHASEVAELLDTTVQSVNSALQRARATLADSNLSTEGAPSAIDDDQRELLGRYVEAFERFDIDELVALLHEDATIMMPPFPLWLRGSAEFGSFLRHDGGTCQGSRVVRIAANGMPAFAQWKAAPDGGYDAWAIHTLAISDGRIAGIDFFVDPALFGLFDLPVHVDG